MYTISYEVPQGESPPVLTMKPDIVIEVLVHFIFFKVEHKISSGLTFSKLTSGQCHFPLDGILIYFW